jgi:hypothetical protein
MKASTNRLIRPGILACVVLGLPGLHGTVGAGPCYPNCDGSVAPPILNVADFACFLNRFAAGDAWADCNGDAALNVLDLACFLNAYAAGC